MFAAQFVSTNDAKYLDALQGDSCYVLQQLREADFFGFSLDPKNRIRAVYVVETHANISESRAQIVLRIVVDCDNTTCTGFGFPTNQKQPVHAGHVHQ
jgi:hypothetical protein